MEFAISLAGALILDFLFGELPNRYHPVAWFGKLAAWTESYVNKLTKLSVIGGMCVGLFCVLFSSFIAGVITYIGLKGGAILGGLVATIIIYFTIAAKSLCEHATAVAAALKSGDVNLARKKVALFVSRDPDYLDENGIIRSCLESLGENVIDAVTAALFWATIGYACGGLIGMVVGAVFYRASNTLDAMFGYKNERYIKFGFFVAKLDDILNYIPARLTVFAVALAVLFLRLVSLSVVSKRYKVKIMSNKFKIWTLNELRNKHLCLEVLKCAWRDRNKHPSPSSMWGMASFAGALGVRLGGKTYYKSGVKNYPYFGTGNKNLELADILKACHLVWGTTIIFALGSGIGIYFYF